VLSALNSGLYASSRMLMAMGRRNDAPHALAKLNSRGVPVLGIVTGTVFGYFAVIMSYVSPHEVFPFLVNSYGTVAIFVYVLIALAELKLRGRLQREAPERLRLRMWGYPYLTILALCGMLCILTAMAFIREQRVPLVFGILSAFAMLCGYLARRRFGPSASAAAPPLGETPADAR
jgi:GABA permease